MGIDPGHCWANFYLSKNECIFISKLTKKDFAQAENFLGTLLMIFVYKTHGNMERNVP